MLADTLRQMQTDGRHHALAFFTSAFSSYSGCRQYRENIAAAQAEVGSDAPAVDKLRAFFNHPSFIEPMIERTLAAFTKIPADGNRQATARLAFTAHSIPVSMAANCKYELQLRSACELVVKGVSASDNVRRQWELVYQSRSGSPTQPWLEPDVNDHLRKLAAEGVRDVVIVPIGFISDHMEVLYDLDTEAKQTAASLSMNMVRVETVGTHPRFVQMIRELIVERISGAADRPALGSLGPNHDVCPDDCCLANAESRRQTAEGNI